MDVRDLDNGVAEQAVADALAARGEAVSIQALTVVAKRLRMVGQGWTPAQVYAWLARDMGMLRQLLERGAGMLEKAGADAMEELGSAVDDWAAPFYAAKKVRQASSADSPYLSRLLESGVEKMGKDVRSMCRTSACRIFDGSKWVPLTDWYGKVLTTAALNAAAGRDTAKQVRKAVYALSGSGLRVQYKSGATRELYSAVSQSVRDQYSQTMQDMRNQQAKEFGADGVAISAHSYCAPDHLPYQGRRFKDAEFEKIQSSLKRPIGGYGCRHHYVRVIVGIGRGAYTDEQREKMREASEKTVTYVENGVEKQTTGYGFTQHQRAVETSIRKLKGAGMVADSAGDAELAKDFRRRAKAAEEAYKAQCKAAGFEPRMERTKVYDWKPFG